MKQDQEKLAKINDSIPYGIIIYDREYNLHFTNLYAREHITCCKDFSRRLRTMNIPGEISFPCEQGQIYFEIISDEIEWDNQSCTITFWRDITARIKVIKALQKSEKKYRTFTENIDLALFRIEMGEKYIFIEVNPALARLFGFSGKRSVLHKSFDQFFQKETDFTEFIRLTEQNDQVKDQEYILQKSNHQGFLGTITAVKVKDSSSDKIYLDGFIKDITKEKNAEDKIRSALQEKELMLREINHRVKNNLQIISSILKLQSSYIHDETYLRYFKNSANRIRTMSLLHEKIYNSGNFAQINLSNYIYSLISYLTSEYKVDYKKVKTEVDIGDILFEVNQAIPLGLIINEILSNSYKYAFPGDRKGEISIKLIDSADQYLLKLSDNGVGLSKVINFESSDSLGFYMIKALSQQLHSKIEVFVNNGTEFRITLPKIAEDDLFRDRLQTR